MNNKKMNTRRFAEAISDALRPEAKHHDRCEALVLAAGIGDTNSMEQLVERYKIPVNFVLPGERRTALHAACIFSQPACVKLLLNYGANPTIRDKRGKSPLDLSAESALDLATDPCYRLLLEKITRVSTFTVIRAKNSTLDRNIYLAMFICRSHSLDNNL